MHTIIPINALSSVKPCLLASGRSKHFWRFIAWIMLAGCLASCGIVPHERSSWLPPELSTEADLLGTWTRVNPMYDSEAVKLNADHTFTQTYELRDHSLHSETHGTWHVESRPSGCRYLHLDGMRNFHLTDSAANNGNRYPDGTLMSFWEPCEDRLITIPDRMILIIGNMPNFPRGFVLLYPRNGAESTDVMLWLNAQSDGMTRQPK